ncbi:G-type lectin S-receptor-like serine/threonine-protein kinase CES101 [Vitis vinifera]|uniref:non-specific serine/threonine protein kinase n=1 Tax=Vitis vinifera TaxID=29760 RepID=A0A438HS92_VITVI|nr:G-type lectin S-receptor-like serine/threonine-protein kinase CES101 [Vitis vinifera]
MLRPRVPGDPRGCQMDGRTISTNIGGCRAIITLRAVLTEIVVGDAAVRDRGRWRTWAMAGCCDNVRSGYETCVTCIRMGRMVTCAMCHHEVRGTCSQEEGSLQLGVVPYISSAQIDTIKPGEELQFSEKLLVSAKGTFTLGFFSLESGSYLGIWFTIDAQKEKVWVANRDKPISGTDANLTLDADGKLMIMHSGGDPIVLNSNQAARNSTATLLDSGNFVLEEFNSDRSVKEKLWESFDNPTDTLLPGMKLGINLKTGQNWSLASWINEQVPAPGTFTLEWNGTQFVMKRRGGTYWSSGTLKNRSFEFIPWLSFDTCNNIYCFNSVANENEIYFSYSVPDGVVSEWALNSRGDFLTQTDLYL